MLPAQPTWEEVHVVGLAGHMSGAPDVDIWLWAARGKDHTPLRGTAAKKVEHIVVSVLWR
jgi:hypothetical protein